MVNKTKFIFNCKNTVLKIDQQGRSFIVTLERKVAAQIYDAGLWLSLGLLLLLLITSTSNNIETTKYLTTTLVFISGYCISRVVKEESLVMVNSLGYQVATKYIVGQRKIFIPWTQVHHVFINEVIVRGKVIDLLTLLISDKGEEKLIPVFANVQPRLACLEIICKYLKAANSL